MNQGRSREQRTAGKKGEDGWFHFSLVFVSARVALTRVDYAFSLVVFVCDGEAELSPILVLVCFGYLDLLDMPAEAQCVD